MAVTLRDTTWMYTHSHTERTPTKAPLKDVNGGGAPKKRTPPPPTTSKIRRRQKRKAKKFLRMYAKNH